MSLSVSNWVGGWETVPTSLSSCIQSNTCRRRHLGQSDSLVFKIFQNICLLSGVASFIELIPAEKNRLCFPNVSISAFQHLFLMIVRFCFSFGHKNLRRFSSNDVTHSCRIFDPMSLSFAIKVRHAICYCHKIMYSSLIVV